MVSDAERPLSVCNTTFALPLSCSAHITAQHEGMFAVRSPAFGG